MYVQEKKEAVPLIVPVEIRQIEYKDGTREWFTYAKVGGYPHATKHPNRNIAMEELRMRLFDIYMADITFDIKLCIYEQSGDS